MDSTHRKKRFKQKQQTPTSIPGVPHPSGQNHLLSPYLSGRLKFGCNMWQAMTDDFDDVSNDDDGFD